MRGLVTLMLHDVYETSPEESGFPGPAAARYKLRRPTFEAQLEALKVARADDPVLLTHDVPPTRGDRALSFAITADDGGISYYTIMADRLEALGWRGHCFVATDWIGRPGFLDKRQLRELRGRGHVIGSHSASHPSRFSACGWPRLIREWEDSCRLLADVLGEDVTVASVPGGYFSSEVARAARQAGLRVLFTSEPSTRLVHRRGLLVAGRFAIRHACGVDFARRLATGRATALWGEWLGWNAKKLLKTCLGETYPRLARRLHGAARAA